MSTYEETGKQIDGTPAVSGAGLRQSIPNLLAMDTKNWLSQYGIREDDSAMVFHFFPKTKWDPRYKMDKRLEAAIEKCFDTTRVRADFAEELDSFCVIVAGFGASLDPWPMVHRFLSSIDDALVA